jgi:hypothetical protein
MEMKVAASIRVGDMGPPATARAKGAGAVRGLHALGSA